MESRKTSAIVVILPLIFFAAAGVVAFFTLPNVFKEEPLLRPEPPTSFHVVNESEISFGKPAIYRIMLENHENETTDYELKIRLAGEEIYNEEITLDTGEDMNQTISFIPDKAGEYLRLEFLLYKDNEPYRNRVFQIFPSIDHTLASNFTTVPPFVQNGEMEKDGAWVFKGRGFAGNYTASEWSSPKRSYQIKSLKGVKKNASGSIMQNFSSEKDGFTSLSFDVKSSNASYYLQVLVNDNVVWENTTGKDWQRIRVPVFVKKSNRLELKITAKNDTRSGAASWWDNIRFVNYSSTEIENIKKKAETYTRQSIGDITVYRFNTGENLELKLSKDGVNPGNAVYTTANKGNSIIFLGGTHEKILPNMANFLLPVTMDIKDKKLKINETLNLKNRYAVTLKQIKNQSLYLSIIRNNKTVREIISEGNSSIEYWKEINAYKKQKVIQIIPRKIDQSEAVFDIIQYGNKKAVFAGNKYGEFKVANVTNNSIIMENVQPLKIEAGKEISLISGKIKIKG